jgi:hypothetical protein
MTERGRGRGRGQRGYRGQRGGSRIRGGTSGRGNSSTVCFEYLKTGKCSRDECRYLHHPNTGGTKAQIAAQETTGRVRSVENVEQQQARGNYNDWKKLLGIYYVPSDDYTMRRVWEGAEAILQEDDRDWKQQLPRDLDDSSPKCNGRAHVKAILEKRTSKSDPNSFIEISNSFLGVLTHPSILDCLAVDTYVGGLYNFTSGVNGDRAIAYFRHLCETLVDAKADGVASISQGVLDSALVNLTKALCELLRRDQRARLHDHLGTLVVCLENAAQIIPAEYPSMVSTIVEKVLANIQAMISRTLGLLAEPHSPDVDEASSITEAAASYPRDVIIPQDRHDNDKKDIADIVIFPTRDEIISDAREFLPSTDRDQPHFLMNKVERHIDTNFRLLRHDIFGELKQALASFMHAAGENPATISHPKINLGDMRAYHYPQAYVSHLSFSTRRGLEAQISFPQPTAVRKKTHVDRRAWWEDSKRLDEGSLLSLIWIQNSTVEHMFFTVTQKNTKQGDDKSLSDDSMATIKTKLMTQDHRLLQSLLRLSLDRAQCVLLEFPGVLPATFVPILENLQNMQRLSRLPFQQWLLPDRHGGSSNLKMHHDIPPPLYARRLGFTFPLIKIQKANTDALAIEPSSSCEDAGLVQKIAERTGLDLGQCRALIAALTREFTFIQGPPGTGKSYIGLQIMRILLDIKDSANLGPIVVV